MECSEVIDEATAIAWMLARTHAANGDDTATIAAPGARIVVSTDATSAGIHAPAGCPARQLGRRAAARAVSDLAASGATPIGMTLAVQVPDGDGAWGDAAAAAEGALERGEETGVRLVGGDFSRTSGTLGLVVTVLGVPPAGGRVPGRRGARPGHVLCITGTIGAATAALLRGEATLPEPPDRLRAGRALAPVASAMLDVSDGLLRDAGHLAAGSGCGWDIELDALPVHPDAKGQPRELLAVGGDDYELLVALAPEHLDTARAALDGACPGLPFTQVGIATIARTVRLLRDGRSVPVSDTGYVHR